MAKNHKKLKFFAVFLILVLLLGGGYYLCAETNLIIPELSVEFVCDEQKLDDKTKLVKKYTKIGELPTASKEGYEFLGWYDGDTLYKDDFKITKKLTLVAKFKPTKVKITFVVDGVSFEEDEDYDSMPEFDGTPQKESTATKSYSFLRWDPELQVVKEPTTYTAVFKEEQRKYSVSVVLSHASCCDVSGTGNDFVYNSSAILSISNIKNGYHFLGWYDGDTMYADSTNLSININSITKDIILTAKFRQDFYAVNFIVDDLVLSKHAVNLEYDDVLQEPVVDAEKDYSMGGYKIVGWYTDESLTNKFEFGNKLDSDTTLYARWEYILDLGFYSYLTKFAGASTSINNAISIDSFNELVSYVDYVAFYDIITENYVKLSYSYDELDDEIKNAISATRFAKNVRIRYVITSIGSNEYAKIIVSEQHQSIEATRVADLTGESVCSQYSSANITTKTTKRADDYDLFAIENVKNELAVETTNQLVYALECGLKPVCKTNSSAERIYNKAKLVLREICTDDMDYVQKAKAIYDWIILNTEYDNKAVSTSSVLNVWWEYNSWFAEGVFDNGIAVCDGFAKAYLILAKIEGIPTVRVNSTDHAWNKVYIGGKWYGVDATHGNIISGSSEVLSYSSFMFTDSYKAQKGNIAENYLNLVADTEYNYYANANINGDFDFSIDSYSELQKLLEYVDELIVQNLISGKFTLEFVVSDSYGTFSSYLVQTSKFRFTGTYVSMDDIAGLKLLILECK